jgi:hypothetical protein
MMRPPTVPEYLRTLPDNARLTARDLAPIFGYASPASLASAAHTGYFPRPYGFFAGNAARGWRGKAYWRPDTIRAEVARRRRALHAADLRVALAKV